MDLSNAFPAGNRPCRFLIFIPDECASGPPSQIAPIHIRAQLFAANDVMSEAFNIGAAFSWNASRAIPPKTNGLRGHVERFCETGGVSRDEYRLFNCLHKAKFYICRNKNSTSVFAMYSTVV